MPGTSASARPRTSASSIRTAYWRVEPSALKSQGKNTPFLGLEVRGKVRTTLVAGRIVHEA